MNWRVGRMRGLGRKGQIGPQALEDIPASVIALISGLVVVAIFFGIYLGHSDPASRADMHYAGKRLLERVIFQDLASERSASFGNFVLDSDLLGANITMTSIEYSLRLHVEYGSEDHYYGDTPEGSRFAYSYPVTILDGSSLHSGRATLMIWKK